MLPLISRTTLFLTKFLFPFIRLDILGFHCPCGSKTKEPHLTCNIAVFISGYLRYSLILPILAVSEMSLLPGFSFDRDVNKDNDDNCATLF